MIKSRFALLSTLFLSLCAAFLVWMGFSRMVAPDEGYYLLAARLLLDGKSLYRDFFYPQMPFFPYLFAGWMKIAGVGWEQARLFNSIINILCMLVLFEIVRLKTSRFLACLAVLLFVGAGLVLGWFSITKPYGASTLFCLISYWLLQLKSHSLWRVFWSGLFLALAVNCRSYFVVLLPIFLIWLLQRSVSEHSRLKTFGVFILGGILTLIPQLGFLISDFSTFWFNNVGYHLLRSEMPAAQQWQHRFEILSAVIGLRADPRFDGVQLPLLCAGALLHLLRRAWAGRAPDPAFWIGFALFLVSIAPIPVHPQYFCLAIPFMIICSMIFLHESLAWCLTRTGGVGAASLLLLVLIGFYLKSFPGSIKSNVSTGVGVALLKAGNSDNATLGAIKAVSAEINLRTKPGEVVLSRWPGYLLESHAQPYPGTENQFWVRVGHRLSAEDRRAYRIIDRNEFRTALTDPKVKLVITEESALKGYFSKKALIDNGFKEVKQLRGVMIYAR
ncbi:MAG: glycosyltransferase family 39 protein [Deltaproteobacteria bacterium]|nr:glycosyltransferase family 39 protein [Deltaproteobacteria bacterium]